MLARQQDQRWGDIGIALLLAGLLTLGWTVQGWAELSVLRLPDTDDVVRLQQIRDWIGGQAFGDLAQHRLGPAAGLEMHWSRMPDIVPAAIIVVLSPLFGVPAAELAAVLLWPASAFAVSLAFVTGIARALGAPSRTAALVAALAYPATTLFMPGRIDHHGLQVLLLLATVWGTSAQGTRVAGMVAGGATALSLAIGVETAPMLGIVAAAIMVRWCVGGRPDQARFEGYSVALFLSLAAAAALLRGSSWNWPVCDSFTAVLWRGAQALALAPLVLAGMGRLVEAPRLRWGAAGVVAACACIGVLLLLPGCLSPYGEVDPMLARIWLANVAEAQPMFDAPLSHAIGYCGLLCVGLVSGVWIWRRSSDHRWWIILSLQLVALMISLVQLRGAYAGAMLAAPALAALIGIARKKGSAALIGAWLVSAGLSYPLLGAALSLTSTHSAVMPQCTSPALSAALASLPPGTVMAPVDMGAFLLAGTPHRIVAAPYHRNGAANAAMYHFYLGPPRQALEIARELRVDYVVWCEGGLGTIDFSTAAVPSAFVHRRPDWLVSIPVQLPELEVYRMAQ